MIKPVSYCLLACFFWGLIFVAPLFLEDFSSIDIVIGRFLSFGLISIFLFAGNLFYGNGRIALAFWKEACLCALMMNFFYYTALTLGMRLSDPSVIALIVGTAPIFIAALSEKKDRTASGGSFLFPSVCIFAGIVIVNIPALQNQILHLTLWEYLQGIFYGIFSLAIWVWYVVYNTTILQKNPQLNPRHWTLQIGVATLMFALAAFTIRWLTLDEEYAQQFSLKSDLGIKMLTIMVILGVICSWFAFTLWNIASSLLPPSITGQLAILETVFGILFIYTVQQKMPTLWEGAGIALILGGIWKGLHNFGKKATPHLS